MKINLANQSEIEAMWREVTFKHGPVHLLIINAAICFGRKVSEFTIEQVRLTININFMSYVSLMMLFMA